MLSCLVCVEAKHGSNVVIEGAQNVGGYFQTLGVTATDDSELRQIVRDFLYADLQSELVEISEQWPPDFEGADQDIADVVGAVNRVGIWYASGRAWFSADEE